MIVDALMAGAIGTTMFGVDDTTGKVFALDENGKPIREVPEAIAQEVKEAIKRGKAAAKQFADTIPPEGLGGPQPRR